MHQSSRTIVVCRILIAVSVAALVVGELLAPAWSLRLPIDDRQSWSTQAIADEPGVAPERTEAAATVVVGEVDNLDQEYVSEDPVTGAFDEDNEDFVSAADLARSAAPIVASEDRYVEVLERLTSSYPDNPQHDIEAIWALALDLGKQAEVRLALSPYLSHADSYIAELANSAIHGLSAQPGGTVPATYQADESYSQVAELQGIAWSAADAAERLEAVGELGSFATPESAYALEVTLYQEASDTVRREALRALGNIALMDVEAERIHGIVARMANDASPEVAQDARNIMSQLAEQT